MFIFHQGNDTKYAARATMEWYSCDQISDLNSIENVSENLKIAFHKYSQFNLSEHKLYFSVVFAQNNCASLVMLINECKKVKVI